MRLKLRAALVGSFALTTCGPGDVVQPELEEVCGVDGPFRVLELPPDQQLHFGGPLQIGDRVLYVVHQRGVDTPDPHYNPPKVLFPEFLGSTVWSVGPCGESPVQLTTDVDDIFTLDIWPNEALARTDDGDIVRLDPTGVDPPHVVFTADPNNADSILDWTPYGPLSIEDHGDGTAALLLHPYPADPRDEAPTPRVLLDAIQIPVRYSLAEVFRSFDEFVFAITPDHTMVRVQLADGLVTPLQAGVRNFSTAEDSRQFVWESDEPFGADLFLRDVVTGNDVFLAQASLRDSELPPLWRLELGMIEIRLAPDEDTKRLFFLPDFNHVDIPGDLLLLGPVDEHRWLANLSAFSGLLDLFDLRTLKTTRLFPRQAQVRHHTPDTVDVFEGPPCCILGDERDVGPLWRVPLDGSEPHRLVERMTRNMWRRDDGRYLGPTSIDEAWLGPLVLIDPETGTEQQIDDRVFAYSLHAPRDEDDITYSVADGERSGIWIARLPPATSDRAASSPLPPAFDVVPGPDGPQLRPRAEHPLHIRTGALQRTND